ncbi:uncharacterized protein LOC135136400 [Zophobas morio]|uniref:uncharacterized protein LOC135136400 n=1 Tax=Zophobas morio TaxID=2755281 RepID=UPI0030837D3D
MNKYIFVAFALVVVIDSVRSDFSEDIIDNVKSKQVKKLLAENKHYIKAGLGKLEQQCPGVTQKLKAGIKAYQQCDEKSDDSLTICQTIETSNLNCTKQLIRVFDDCLPPMARALPTMALKALVSVAGFLCKQTGESIFELANPCFWEPPEQSDQVCEEKVNQFVGKYAQSEHGPTKAETCAVANSYMECIRDGLGGGCKNQKTKDVVYGLFEALMSPCRNLSAV